MITLKIPSSSANVGLFFDTGCLGLKNPHLKIIYKKQKKGISVEIKSPFTPPSGRELGYAGKTALEHFLSKHGVSEGAKIIYEDEGFPVGGLGRSGAEAVGAIMAAAVLYEIPLTRNDVITFAAFGESGNAMDNTAGSTNGNFNIISISPITQKPCIDLIKVPDNLGISIGFSSHKKTQGTEGLRKILQKPVDSLTLITQCGRIAAATYALSKNDVDRFLEVVIGDCFHEVRRANIGGYGNFNANEFFELKRKLFNSKHVALNVSGAGPNMQFLYNKKRYPKGIANEISSTVIPWFKQKHIKLEIKDLEIAKTGAYDYAIRKYGYKGK
ncbi:MAG: hypothetical protein Q8P80_03135 [Candidatus Levybacteria bacterium]|nr:hypothetical protein [Candidatus Levybacteria bacterium]